MNSFYTQTVLEICDTVNKISLQQVCHML